MPGHGGATWCWQTDKQRKSIKLTNLYIETSDPRRSHKRGSQSTSPSPRCHPLVAVSEFSIVSQ